MKNSLEIVGLDGDSWSVSFDTLRELPNFAQVEDVSKLDAKKTGSAIPLSALIPDDERDRAEFITVFAEGGAFSASLPLKDVIGRALVIYRDGRNPLPREKGGPFRFWVPDAVQCNTGPIDNCANVKGLERIELTKERGPDSRKKKYDERGC